MASSRKSVVCQICFSYNNETIDLIKTICRDEVKHKNSPRIRVYWDGTRRCLEQVEQGLPTPIRPFQPNWIDHGRRFVLCHGADKCKGPDCHFCHSFEEQEAWNSKLPGSQYVSNEPPPPIENIGTSEDYPPLSAASLPKPANLPSRWPTATQMDNQTRTCQDSPMPHFQDFSLPKQPSNVLPSSRVGMPSSEQPLPILTASLPTPIVTASIPAQTKQVSDNSDQAKVEKLLADAAKEITLWGYKDKFLALLELEEMEHARILKTRCSGCYVISLCPIGQKHENARVTNDSGSDYERYGYILGLNWDQIEYCTQASSGLTLVGGIEAEILFDNMSNTEEKLCVAFNKENSQKLKSISVASDDIFVDVTFKLKYSYFDRLRKSVNNIQPNVLRNICPQPGDFHSLLKCSYSPTIRGLMSGCSGDKREALEAILSCPPFNSPPILITGAFGTGKTHILAVAACCLFEQARETAQHVRILATSHHQRSPDSFLEQYYGLKKGFNYENAVVICLQNREQYNHAIIPHQIYYNVAKFKKELHRIKGHRLFMLACTYGGALSLAESLPGFFTHILYDEGAQSREPEALSPLLLANANTKIIIAGDQHQVGPRTLVLGKAPQQHGLAVSLLERLYNLYMKPDFKECARQYSYVLTTNFRCHPDILKFLGELFYEVPLSCRRPPPLHPLAKSSFLFVCSSVDAGVECVGPSQPFDEEACVLLEEVTKYMDSWPREWGYKDTQDACLICSTRHQIATVKNLQDKYPKAGSLKKLLVYAMQGEEVRACFISTTEPTWKDGSSRNPTKSICDPYIFNTALTRAQSLVVAVGNPFLLLKMEKHMVKRYGRHGRGWSTYIRECLDRGGLSISSLLKVNAAQERLCMSKLRELTGLNALFEPMTKQNLSPSPPIGLKAERIKTTSITISWQPPHDPNGIIRYYQVSYTSHGERECLYDVVGDTTSTELTSLKPHTEYTICVRAKTVDFGDYNTPITVSTLEEVPPSPPIGLKAERIKTTSMAISWQPPHDVSGIIRGYQVSYTPHGESECLHNVVADTTSTELTSLIPHTEYTIRVRAKTVDFGNYSTLIAVSTLEDDFFEKKISSILDNYKDITFKQLRIIKLIFYGTPRAGKTTLRKQLLTFVEDPLQPSTATLQPSTNVAEICDPVFVERIVINEENNEWRWTVQKLDDIAKTLLQCLDNQLLQCEEAIDVREEPNVTAAQRPTAVTLMPLNQYVQDEQMAGTTEYVPPSQIVTEREKDPHVPITMLPIVEHTSSTVIDIKQLFSEAVETGQWSEVVGALNIDRAMLMQVIDGGGQPSFQEIFPLLISGPSVTLLMFKLTDDLQKAHDVQYQPIDGVEHTWKDTYVVRDFIFHALSGMVSFTDDINNPFGCKILLVGTHKDRIKGSEDQKKDEIMKIAKSMHGWLQEKKAFRSIHVHNIEDLVTGIDNSKRQDIEKVKNKIEKLLSQTPTKDIPAPWLVFDFVLHKYAKSKQLRKVEKIKCEQIANKCGVKDEEFEVVLQYLHYEAGTLLYYSGIPELRNCVITDFQLIIDSISNVIIDYFDDSCDHGPHMEDKNLLHTKGQLKASVLKDVQGCLKVNELLSLMQHRNIISKMDGDMLFMPSVLPKAAKSDKIASDSCSFLVMFEQHGCCPIGLFCAVTTSLIVTHKCRVTQAGKPHCDQFRDKISLYYCCSGKSYHVIFSAFFAHYEICIMDREAKPNIKYAIYKVINEVFITVCKDMNYPFPSYGFYCPCAATHLPNEHPAKCTFDMEAQEMICCYSNDPSDLTDEHKSWFQEVQPQEQINVPTSSQSLSQCKVSLEGTPNIKLLTDFPYLAGGVKTNLNIIQRTSASYTKLGMHLLDDVNCDIVDGFEEKYHHDPVKIVTAIYKMWVSGTGRKPATWQTLIGVLRDIVLNSLADDIEYALNHPA